MSHIFQLLADTIDWSSDLSPLEGNGGSRVVDLNKEGSKMSAVKMS